VEIPVLRGEICGKHQEEHKGKGEECRSPRKRLPTLSFSIKGIKKGEMTVTSPVTFEKQAPTHETNEESDNSVLTTPWKDPVPIPQEEKRRKGNGAETSSREAQEDPVQSIR